MDTEQQLIEQATAGSVAAFTGLVESYRSRLYRFLLSRCRTRQDAEDALQDTLISAYRYLPSYNNKWRFSTWLYRIAMRNAMKNDDGEHAELGEVCDTRSGPLEQVMADSESDNLWSSARRTLNEEVYAAMWLRYAEDMSVKEIAVALDRTVSWTKINLLRARKVLDAELNRSESEAYG